MKQKSKKKFWEQFCNLIFRSIVDKFTAMTVNYYYICKCICIQIIGIYRIKLSGLENHDPKL